MLEAAGVEITHATKFMRLKIIKFGIRIYKKSPQISGFYSEAILQQATLLKAIMSLSWLSIIIITL